MEPPENILVDIAGGEGQHREFKARLDNPERIAGEIVAFANSEGGTLNVGVDDQGHVCGVDDADKAFQMLTNICRDRCIPAISPVIQQQTIRGKEVVVLTILPALNQFKPYRTAGGRFYIRSGKDKKDATGRELVRIAQAAGELHYDESPVIGASLQHFSIQDFEKYHVRQFGMSLDEHLGQSGLELPDLLRNLRLVYELEGELVLTVAGVLVFGTAPQQFLPQSRVSAVAFACPDEDSGILDRREMTGPSVADRGDPNVFRAEYPSSCPRTWFLPGRYSVIRPKSLGRSGGECNCASGLQPERLTDSGVCLYGSY